MTIPPPIYRRNRLLTGLAATLALHLALICAWRTAHPAKPDVGDDAARIQWVDVALRPVIAPAPRPHEQAPRTPARRVPQATPRPAPRVLEQAPTPMPAPPAMDMVVPLPAPVPVAEPQATRSFDDIRRQASKDLGKIDQELRKQFPGPRGIQAPHTTPQSRLQRGIELAHEAVPPKWYQVAKLQEIAPGPDGSRRYRVNTAVGSYCIRVESNRGPAGFDSKSRKTDFTNCPDT